MSDLNNLSSDVLNAIVNGYDAGINPVDGSENLFPGLLNAGSFLDELYTTWPEQFVTALGSLGAESARRLRRNPSRLRCRPVHGAVLTSEPRTR